MNRHSSRRVIFAPHGEYDRKTLALTPEGKEQIRSLATLLLPHIRKDLENNKLKIWTSPQVRALETLEILQTKLEAAKVPWKRTTALDRYIDPMKEGDYELVFRLLDDEDSVYHTLLCITHPLVVEEFPPLYLKRTFGVTVKKEPIPSGQAVMLDLNGKDRPEHIR